MSSPRFEPWLMPDTISSGGSSISPSTANLTQSTGVPSVAKPCVPSSKSISSTHSGWRVVIDRAVALRFEFGAITETSRPGTASSARRIACRPRAWMPSSFVSRTRVDPLGAQHVAVEANVVGLRGREGREVVRAADRGGAPIERLAVEEVSPVERAAALERARRRAREDAIAVGAAARVAAGVEAVRGDLALQDAHVRRQDAVQRVRRGRRAGLACDLSK